MTGAVVFHGILSSEQAAGAYCHCCHNVSQGCVTLICAGGPGCSSELAVFYENGPYNIKEDLTLTPNPYGWDAAGSIIYVDQVAIDIHSDILVLELFGRCKQNSAKLVAI